MTIPIIQANICESKQVLEGRGILAVATKYQWQAKASGFEYPVFHYEHENIIGYRFKNSDSHAKPKYKWIASKPKDNAADWYILPTTKQAIAEKENLAYLANGEPALLAYHAAGIGNVIATTLSEVSVPKQLVNVLSKLGIERLLYPVDKDEAGTLSASKWRDALLNSNIEFVAYDMPDYLANKSDINDLWIYAKFKQDVFQETLLSLKRKILAQPIVLQASYDEVVIDKKPQALIEAIVSAARICGYRGSGDWINGSCLFPEHHSNGDKSVSAGININSAVLNCFVCGQHHPRDVAKRLGIDCKRYYRQDKRDRKRAPSSYNQQPRNKAAALSMSPDYLAIIQINERFFSAQGLPDWYLRAFAIATESRKDGLVYSKLISKAVQGELAAKDEDWGISRKQMRAAIGYPEKNRTSFDKALDQLIAAGFVILLATEYTQLAPNNMTQAQTSSQLYQINISQDDVAAWLIEALARRYKERLFSKKSKLIALPDDKMSSQIDIYDEDGFKQWEQSILAINQASDKAQKAIKNYHRELFGFYQWPGWRDVLYQSAHDTYLFTADELALSVATYRVQSFKKIVLVEDRKFKQSWCRLLGTLSDSTVDNVRERCEHKGDVNKTETSISEIDLETKQDIKRFKQVIERGYHNARRELKGQVIEIKLHMEGQSNPISISGFCRKEVRLSILDKNREQTSAISYVVQSASTYRPMSAVEREHYRVQKAEKASQAAQKQRKDSKPAGLNDKQTGDPNKTMDQDAVLDYQSDWLHHQVSYFFEMVDGSLPSEAMTDKEIVFEAIQAFKQANSEERARMQARMKARSEC